jgi:hypothetical protein
MHRGSVIAQAAARVQRAQERAQSRTQAQAIYRAERADLVSFQRQQQLAFVVGCLVSLAVCLFVLFVRFT